MKKKIATESTLDGEIQDRIKTFEDACKEIGVDPTSAKFISGDPDTIAYEKLKVITGALNEGVKLDYSNSSQRKWYPWFWFEKSGFRFTDACYVIAPAIATGGSRLCFVSEELATYAGKQFIEIYNTFLK